MTFFMEQNIACPSSLRSGWAFDAVSFAYLVVVNARTLGMTQA